LPLAGAGSFLIMPSESSCAMCFCVRTVSAAKPVSDVWRLSRHVKQCQPICIAAQALVVGLLRFASSGKDLRKPARTDLKSLGRFPVRVRVPPSAPIKSMIRGPTLRPGGYPRWLGSAQGPQTQPVGFLLRPAPAASVWTTKFSLYAPSETPR